MGEFGRVWGIGGSIRESVRESKDDKTKNVCAGRLCWAQRTYGDRPLIDVSVHFFIAVIKPLRLLAGPRPLKRKINTYNFVLISENAHRKIGK